MIYAVKVNAGKPILNVKAGESMTRGCPVTRDYADDTVDKATATTDIYLVDVAPKYEGINAVVNPTDGSFETINNNDRVLAIPTYVGERYATTELTVGTLEKGDYLKASAGKFVAGAANDICEWVYVGQYANPTALTMYEVERVAPFKVTA